MTYYFSENECLLFFKNDTLVEKPTCSVNIKRAALIEAYEDGKGYRWAASQEPEKPNPIIQKYLYGDQTK
jgi:hypothetical protein